LWAGFQRHVPEVNDYMVAFRKTIKNQIEYRFDPLTQEESRINPARAKRLKQAEGDASLREIIERSRETCAFCPERLHEQTPTLPEAICKAGRIKMGETVVFPNLNPFGENHAVATLSEGHFLDLDEFRLNQLRDNLLASKEYILSVYAHDKEATSPLWVWNYMPPSAGSIIHPHVQILVEKEPVPRQARLLGASKRHFELHKTVYWEDLVAEEERLGERYIFGNDSLSVIASFAPRGFNEIEFIFNQTSLTDLEEKEIGEFADILTRALRGYKALGVGSFNLLTYSGPLDKKLDYYSLHAKLFSRPYPRGVYTSDTGPMERGYDVWVIDTLPEELASKMRPFFA
jgi:UDPglucose--hexose-1-phosphate uridylyltransferase